MAWPRAMARSRRSRSRDQAFRAGCRERVALQIMLLTPPDRGDEK